MREHTDVEVAARRLGLPHDLSHLRPKSQSKADDRDGSTPVLGKISGRLELGTALKCKTICTRPPKPERCVAPER